MALIRGNDVPERQGEAQHGMAIFSHEQTAGKGQRGKEWISAKGSNIVLSILLNPYPLAITEQFKLSVCVAVSGHELLSEFAGDETRIKWPNDLYWRDRKAGGVLIENVVREDQSAMGSQSKSGWQWAIVGIGINIRQARFPADLPNPVSLKQITGKDFNPVQLAKKFCSILDTNFRKLLDDKFEDLFNKYQLHLYKKDEKVKFKKGNRVFEAT